MLRDGFCFETSDFSLVDNRFYTKIKNPNEEVIKNKSTGMKRVLYQSDVVDKSSIYAEVKLDDNDDIDKCYIDFRTHKNSNKIWYKNKAKITGMDLIRINNKDKNFSFSYRTRKGDICKYVDNIYYDDENLSMNTLKNRVLAQKLWESK